MLLSLSNAYELQELIFN